MDVRKCIVLLRHRGTLNSRQAASRKVDGRGRENRLATLWKLNNLACETGNPRVVCINVKSVIEEIIHRVKQAKYYAFLLDCTRDVSRIEQMSIILRFCNSSTGAIEEHFVGFIAFAETTGEYIINSILQELERNGLDIQNCRGQGYDNDANMVGINKGVRTRILNINPRAFFTPCGYHSWNLLLIDAANSSATTKTFFGFINKIYVLFSKSSKRWNIVKTNLKLALKPLSETRWGSRIGAVNAIFLQFDDVIECVNELKNKSDDSETLSDCDAVLNEMFSFDFIVAIHVWKFCYARTGDNRLVPGLDYLVDTLKLPKQAPRGSGESLQKCVAWRCVLMEHNTSSVGQFWPFLVNR
ncbi:zinc finger MYM-type protein 1 [Trichonephila clavipes]|uniref:Zinc finger MYM-type protein 1 n=1 Tax=Trichonephila clavipes TaxID=2585209 RepID=A0A8X6RDX7_TRICX|nr:zinc finger MYM-type protein 1 [Trichonephila clavipes]